MMVTTLVILTFSSVYTRTKFIDAWTNLLMISRPTLSSATSRGVLLLFEATARQSFLVLHSSRKLWTISFGTALQPHTRRSIRLGSRRCGFTSRTRSAVLLFKLSSTSRMRLTGRYTGDMRTLFATARCASKTVNSSTRRYSILLANQLT